MIKPSKLAHIVLNSYQAEAMTEWYCAVIGAHVVYVNPPVTFLTFDEEHHRIGIAQMPGDPQDRDIVSPGLQHIAFTFGSASDLLTKYEELKAREILPRVTCNHGPTISFYYRDPDGNIIEMMVDRFATMEESLAFMKGPIFQRNPVGFTIDPEELLEQRKAGASEDELMEYKDIEKDPWGLAVRQRAALGTASIEVPTT